MNQLLRDVAEYLLEVLFVVVSVLAYIGLVLLFVWSFSIHWSLGVSWFLVLGFIAWNIAMLE